MRLKTAYSDDTCHLLFTFEEFIEKLVALIPPPRSHLVRWARVLAPNSPYREEITLKPQKKGFQFQDGYDNNEEPKNYSWLKMLAKALKIGITTCEDPDGKMRAVCSVFDPAGVRRYLTHNNVDYEPPGAQPKHRRESQLIDLGAYTPEEYSNNLINSN